ncbi:MAG: Hsp70 family protein [Phycisphaerae bacterium]|jgi:molecular chaperone DnaK|nr:Hsp70 family protein [Phycisphaerae bacterium]
MNYIGIDLGTTFCAVAHLAPQGRPITIPNAEGELTTPSVVLFESDDSAIVGREAKRAALAEPGNVAEDVKRHMGEESYPKLLRGRSISPINLSAIILKKLLQDAEARLGPIDGAVITVPAYFDENRRQATAAAAHSAGLTLIGIINEPTAAALAHAFRSYTTPEGGVAEILDADGQLPEISVVYDLGGGTFDVTVLRAVGYDLTVLATAGDVQLGGRDWDKRLYDHLADTFVSQHGSDPRDDALSRQQLESTAEEIKKDLSRRDHTLFVVNHAGKSLQGELTRGQFEEMTADLLFRTESRLHRALRDAGIDWGDVDDVLAVGGSTRMPQVQAMLSRVTGMTADASISPDEAVAHGAAIHAAVCVAASGRAETPVAEPSADDIDDPDDIVPGEIVEPVRPAPPVEPATELERLAEAAAVPQTETPAGRTPLDELAAALNCEIPPPESGRTSERQFDTTAIDNEKKAEFLNWLGAELATLIGSIHTTNVNAHTLGVVAETQNGKLLVSPLIWRNTLLPARETKVYATVIDSQEHVTVRIVEGESRAAEDCLLVGTCIIKSLPPGLPKGSPIVVTFNYDADGRLHVHAVHMASGSWAETFIRRGEGVDAARVHMNKEILSRFDVS